MATVYLKLFIVNITVIILSVITLSAQNPKKTVIITDLKGNDIEIPATIKRITVNGALAQMVIMLGCGDQIVATGPSITTNPMLLKIFPQLREVPVIFGTPGGKYEINLEMLVKIQPDVVFGENEVISKLGIPTLAVSLLDFDDIKKTITLMGKVLGPEAINKANDFCAYYDSTISAVSGRIIQLPVSRKPVVYYAGGNDCLSTEGKNAIATAWISASGGINCAAVNNITGSKKVSIENIIYWDPDIIIVSSINGYHEIISSSKWKMIRAVQTGKVFLTPKGVYLWPVRSAEGVLQIPWAATKIHPELFTDIKIENKIRDFYRRFYHYDVNETEIHEILYPVR